MSISPVRPLRRLFSAFLAVLIVLQQFLVFAPAVIPSGVVAATPPEIRYAFDEATNSFSIRTEPETDLQVALYYRNVAGNIAGVFGSQAAPLPAETCSGEVCTRDAVTYGIVKSALPDERIVQIARFKREAGGVRIVEATTIMDRRSAADTAAANEYLALDASDEAWLAAPGEPTSTPTPTGIPTTPEPPTPSETPVATASPTLEPSPEASPSATPSATLTPTPAYSMEVATEPPACEEGASAWLGNVESVNQGKRKDGLGPTGDRSDKSLLYGPPDQRFYSLGNGGTMTLSFPYPIANRSGGDFTIYETSFQRLAFSEETAIVEVSQDGTTYYSLGTVSNLTALGVLTLDFDSTGLSTIRFVRITDTTNFTLAGHGAFADGFDVDAIEGISQDCPDPAPQVLVCKENEEGERLSGWSMTLGPAVTETLVESFELASNDPDGTNTSPLDAGAQYRVEVSGTWTNRGVQPADAEYFSNTNWTTVSNTAATSKQLDVTIDNASFDWGPYSPAHVYSTTVPGAGNPVNVRVFDEEGDNNPPRYYSDNVGSLTVRIFRLAAEGTTLQTNEDGCALFEDLEPGEYVLSEEVREGWEQVTDPTAGEAITVGADNPTYIFVNRQTIEPTPTGTPTLTPTPSILPEEGTLTIQKTNSTESDPDGVTRGSTVTYTIKVSVSSGQATDVNVFDLPPEGFEYVKGSWTAKTTDTTRGSGGNLKGTITGEPTYASPGVWSLGTIQAGETVTLTYRAKSSTNLDPGEYPDIAWARNASGTVISQATGSSYADGEFAGSEVTLTTARETAPAVKVEVRKKDTSGSVLGASTGRGLPKTGASGALLAILILGSGIVMVLAGSRRSLSFATRAIVGMVVVGLFLLAPTVSAADTTIRISAPLRQLNDDSFNIGFVTLDVPNRTVSVTCFKKGPFDVGFAPYRTIAVRAGGSSGFCPVDSSIVSQKGVYEFFARAQANGGVPVDSAPVQVEFNRDAPGTPTAYSKESASSCEYRIRFRTAADGGKTKKVEIYRSSGTTFTADNGTQVGSIAMGSDQDGIFNNTVPECGKTYYYAIRAFDEFGNGSGVVADSETVVTAAGGVTTAGAAGGATAGGQVLGARTAQNNTVGRPATASGEVQGANERTATPEAEASEEGEVLAEITDRPRIPIPQNTRVLVPLILLALGIVFVAYVVIVKRTSGTRRKR